MQASIAAAVKHGRGRSQQRLHRAAATRAILATAAYHALLPVEARGTRTEERGGAQGCVSPSSRCHVPTSKRHVTCQQSSPPLPLQCEEPPWPLQTVLRHYSPRTEHATRLLRMCSKCATSSAVADSTPPSSRFHGVDFGPFLFNKVPTSPVTRHTSHVVQPFTCKGGMRGELGGVRLTLLHR